MNVPMSSEKYLRAALAPLFKIMEQIVREGFNFYFGQYGPVAFTHSPRTRASIINDHIVDLAKQRLPEYGVRPSKRMQRNLFDVQGNCVLHFKKLDRNKLSSNYPTLFSLEFNRQMELPGLPATLPRLKVGYVPTRDWSGIEDVFVTCPNGDRIEWFINLTEENLSTATQPIPTAAPTPSINPNVKTRIGKRQRIKRDDSGQSDAAQS
jgi:hypothetical protein